MAITKLLTEKDPSNAEWRRDLSFAFERIGDIHIATNDGAAALAAFRESLAVSRQLAGSRPDNLTWQSDVSLGLEKVGRLLRLQGGLDEAGKALGESLTIRQALAARQPDNAAAQKNLAIAHYHVAQLAGPDRRQHLQTALDILEGMQARGVLLATDAQIPEQIRKQIAELN